MKTQNIHIICHDAHLQSVITSKLGADLIVSNGEALKQAGGTDVILVTSNSYK